MYQSIGALPVLVIVGLMTGEWNVVASFTGWSDPVCMVAQCTLSSCCCCLTRLLPCPAPPPPPDVHRLDQPGVVLGHGADVHNDAPEQAHIPGRLDVSERAGPCNHAAANCSRNGVVQGDWVHKRHGVHSCKYASTAVWVGALLWHH